MAALIYSATLSAFKTQHPQYNVSTDPAFKSITFTADGYLVTRGTVYNLALDSSDNPYNLAVSTTDGTLSVSVGGKTVTAPVLVDASSGNDLTASVTDGVVKFDHNAPAANTGTEEGASGNSDTSITVPYFKYDSYGHITTATGYTATLNHVVQTTGTGKYYLLGTDTSTTGTRGTLFDTRVFVDGGVLNVAGDTFLKIGTTTLADYVSNAINTVTAEAMIYKGTVGSQDDINALAVSTAKIGDTYKCSVAGTYTINGGSVNLEVGDTLITSTVTTTSGTTTVTYDIIQANIDGAVISSSALTGILYGGGAHTIASIGVGTSGQFLQSTGADAPSWASFASLSIFGKTYSPESSLSITAGNGLTMSGNELVHSNSVTAQATEALYPIKIDAQGHISAYGSAVTTLPDPASLTFTNGTNSIVFNGSAAYSVKPGSNVSFNIASGIVTIASSYVNTTYRMILGTVAGTSDSALSNPYLRLLDNSNGNQGTFRFIGSGATEVSSDASGNMTISSQNTWRSVNGYIPGASSVSSIGANTLQFGSAFSVNTTGSISEVDLGWEIIAADGTVTYE